MDAAAPETAKPNRRRAIVACSVFAVVLAGTIYLLRTNLAYLKWRFIGSEPEVIYDALETGAISPGQVVALVNSGPTYEVRSEALQAIGGSRSFAAPYDDRVVEAIQVFAAELPKDRCERIAATSVLSQIVRISGRPELIHVLETLSEDSDPNVRVAVVGAFHGEGGLGEKGQLLLRKLAADEEAMVRGAVADVLDRDGLPVTRTPVPEWAMPIVRDLLEDPDAGIRRSAVSATLGFTDAEGAPLFAKRLREILGSTGENEDLRDSALRVLFFGGTLDDDELAALADDPQERVARTANRFLAHRRAKREAERQITPSDE